MAIPALSQAHTYDLDLILNTICHVLCIEKKQLLKNKP